MFGIRTKLKKMRADNAPSGFSNKWFEGAARENWDTIIPQLRPRRVLEIGSYEGASATYLIEKLATQAPLELHCVDTWKGGIEHKEAPMSKIEIRFNNNLKAAITSAPYPVEFHKHVGQSDDVLARLLSEGKRNFFDFIYIDGSHQAPDVLCDAILSFRLLRVGGVIAFDDYLWFEDLPSGADLIRSPKLAIDSFTNVYARKLKILKAPLFQLYIEKIAD